MSASDEGRLGIVVVNYGSHRLLEENLGRLDLRGRPVSVVVVDNFSTVGERAAVTALASARGWQLVTPVDNRGFGAGVNAGLRAAREAGCVCFLLLNPDASVDAEVVEELRRHTLREPLAMVAPRLMRSTGAVYFEGSRLLLDSGRIRGRRSQLPAGSGTAEEWLTGACLAVHDDLLRRIGDLDESYFMYWEDVDLSHRCLRAGGRLVVREDLKAVHDEGGTQVPGTGKSPLYYRYNCRNRLLFAARNLPRRQIARWILATPAVSWEILIQGGRRKLLRRPGLLLAALAGAATGLGLAIPALVRRRDRDVPSPAGHSVLVAHPGAEMYGSDRMLAESVAGLLADGLRVVVALPGDGPLVHRLEELGAEVVRCRMPVLRKTILRPAGLLGFLRDAVLGWLPAWRLVRRAGRGGVYVNTIIIPLWAVTARLMGRRLTVHVHEAEAAAARLVRLVLSLPALLAHRVVVNSGYSRDVLVDSVPRVAARTVVVPNGVIGPPRVVPPRARLEPPLRIAYVARLSPRKGPQVAVAALEELRRRGVEARLQLAGSVFPGYEWFETELRAQVQASGLGDRVEFLGFVDDVWTVFAGCDVVVMPSLLDEPFGNSAVEAVLAARPVVVSAAGGLLEAVAGYRTAQAVAPGNPVAWADAIERVVKEWADHVASAAEDAREARHRHDPARYGAEIARVITGSGVRR